MLIITSVLLVPGTVFAEDSQTVISADVTWTGDESVDGVVRIVDGGHLTIDDANVEMALGSSIHVDQGGHLTISQSTLRSDSPPTAIASMGYWDEQNMSRFKVPGEGISGSFEVEMRAMEGDSYYGDAAHIGDDSINLDGSSHTFSFEDGAGDVWIGLTGYSTSSVSIASISISTAAGGVNTILGTDLESVNMKGAGDSGFELHVAGHMQSSSSTLIGGQLIVMGK